MGMPRPRDPRVRRPGTSQSDPFVGLAARAAGPRRPVAPLDLDYRQIYQGAPVMWLVFDRNGIVLDINPAGSQVLGATAEFAIGTPLRMWARADSRQTVLDHLRRCHATNEVVQTDIDLWSASAGELTMRLYSRGMSYKGRIVFPTVAMDVTDRAQLERARLAAERQRDLAEAERRSARAAEAAKDRLVAMVSHELRNPLSPALMAATALERRADLPQDVREMAAAIKRNVQLEARLIDDLLDVAHLTRGQLELRLDVVDVHDVLRRAAEACAGGAQARDVPVHLDLAAKRHHAIADASRLQQVFWNLLSNAIKFSPRGIEVLVHTESGADGVLLVRVRDAGVGMDAATQQRLFSPFEQPRTPPSGRPGLGLGLTIARGIVEMHGGQIWASSEGPGRGSTFEVDLVTTEAPADALTADDTPETETETETETTAPRRGRVLIVEDHEDTAELLGTCLAQRGYDVTLAHSLAQGMAALDQPWHAILTDIGLGDGSGLDLARRITARGRRPERLVALSGYGSERDIEASRKAGFDRHLVKPVDLAELLDVLNGSGH